MRWVKAALLLAAGAALAVASYVVLDNIAVPAAIGIIGVIVACMSVALSGSDDGPAPVANPRAGGSVPSGAPNRVPAPDPSADRHRPAYPDTRTHGHVQTHGRAPSYGQAPSYGHAQTHGQAPQPGAWPQRPDPDAAAWGR